MEAWHRSFHRSSQKTAARRRSAWIVSTGCRPRSMRLRYPATTECAFIYVVLDGCWEISRQVSLVPPCVGNIRVLHSHPTGDLSGHETAADEGAERHAPDLTQGLPGVRVAPHQGDEAEQRRRRAKNDPPVQPCFHAERVTLSLRAGDSRKKRSGNFLGAATTAHRVFQSEFRHSFQDPFLGTVRPASLDSLPDIFDFFLAL